MPPLILGALLAGGLSAVSCALGHRLLRGFAGAPDNAVARLVVQTALGLGLLQYLPLLLLATGTARPIVFRVTTVIVCLVLLPDGVAAVRRASRSAAGPRRLRAYEWTVLAILAVVLAVTFLRAVCPITDDDGLSYHLAGALRLLQAGRFVYIPTLTYANWPQGVEAMFVLLRGLTPAAPVGVVQFLYGALTLAAVWLMARHIGGRLAGAAAAALMLVYTVYWEEMASAHVDLGTALFATTAVLVAVGRPSGSPVTSRRSWMLSAVFAGLAATTKLNGAWVLVAMAVIVFFACRQPQEPEPECSSPSDPWLSALRYGGVASCFVIPWYVRTWVVTGNPVYPMAFGLFGGREWTATGWPRIQHYFLLMNTPPGMPPTMTNLLLGRAAVAAAALAIAVTVYLSTRSSPLAYPARLAAGYTALMFLGSGYNLRFLLAAYPCAIVCGGCIASRWRAASYVTPALAALLAWRVLAHGGEPRVGTATSVALGRTSATDYLRDRLPDYRVVEYCNAHVPAEARVLVATWAEATAYYRPLALRANYWLQDSVHYDSVARLDGDLRRLGVEYVVFEPMDEHWCRRSSVCTGRLRHETAAVEALVRRRGDRLFEANGVALYWLRSPPGA